MKATLKQKFDGSKIKITRIRVNPDWYGNAVHFRYEGQTYRASIREDPDSEDESGNRVDYAHLQVADKFGNWGADIAKKDFELSILIPLKGFAGKARERSAKKDYNKQKIYDRSIPYKFYDTEAFADYLNSVFVKQED